MRSAWKAPFFNPKLLALIESKARLGRDRVIRLPHRRVVIDSSMATCFFSLHTGREFEKLGIHPDMVGHCIGEFVPTRQRTRHHRKKRQKAAEKRRKDEAKKGGKTRVVDTARIAAMRLKRKSRK
jgi:ribosomal protein S19